MLIYAGDPLERPTTSTGRAKVRMGPEGVHLFDRDTGVNLLLDELTPPRAMWSEAPRFMSFALTNACDLTCDYCYAPKHVARLDANALAAWAAELDGAGALGIGFGGGEPTLYPGFAALCRRIHAETDLALSVTTHGHRWTEAFVASVGDALQFVRVSMDGVGDTYSRLRGRPFDLFAERLAVIAGHYRFGINVVVNADTLGELDAIADYVFERGAQELLLLPEVGPDGVGLLEVGQQAQLNTWIEANYRHRRLAVSAPAAAAISSPLVPLTIPGFADRDFLHVDASGLLRVCAYNPASDGVAVAPGSSLLEAIRRVRGESTHFSEIH